MALRESWCEVVEAVRVDEITLFLFVFVSLLFVVGWLVSNVGAYRTVPATASPRVPPRFLTKLLGLCC